MKSGGGRTLGTGKEGIGVAQKLVGSEVPLRVLYRVEEAVVLLGLSPQPAVQTDQIGQAADCDRRARSAHTSRGHRRLRVAVDERGSGRYRWRRGVIRARA